MINECDTNAFYILGLFYSIQFYSMLCRIRYYWQLQTKTIYSVLYYQLFTFKSTTLLRPI